MARRAGAGHRARDGGARVIVRDALRDEILEHFRALVAPSGRPLYVVRRLDRSGLLVQRTRLFDSDPHDQACLITIKPAPDSLRMRDRAIRVPAESDR